MHANDHVVLRHSILVVLIYTQVATSAWNRSNMIRKKESSANATLVPSFRHERASKLESLLPSPSPAHKESRRTFSPFQVQTALFHNCTIGALYCTVSKVPSFWLSETSILVFQHHHLYTCVWILLPGLWTFKILDYNYLDLPCYATDPSHMVTDSCQDTGMSHTFIVFSTLVVIPGPRTKKYGAVKFGQVGNYSCSLLEIQTSCDNRSLMHHYCTVGNCETGAWPPGSEAQFILGVPLSPKHCLAPRRV